MTKFTLKNMTKDYSILILRIGLAFVMIYFGIIQLKNPEFFFSVIPSYFSFVKVSTLVLMNSIFDLVFGVIILMGFFTRISSLIVFVRMMFIISGLGISLIGVRDIGLAFAFLALVLYGGGKLSIDNFLKRRRKLQNPSF